MITISKEDFEAALPVASSKNDDILDMLEGYIADASVQVEDTILGSVGMAAYDSAGNPRLVMLVKRLVCMRAFLPNFRSLDVVLTSTGFGVVSTQDTAPASKMRTDALKSQLDVECQRTEGALLSELFRTEGWGAQPLRKAAVPTLFYHFDFLTRYAGIDSPIINDWRKALPLVSYGDTQLRKSIGDDQMDHLIDAMCSDSLTGEELEVTVMIQQLLGCQVSNRKHEWRQGLMRLLNTMERNTESFPLYMESEAYRYNHFEEYENTKDSGMFLFNG